MALRPPVSEKDHLQGNPHAAIELLEFGDYQCPHCGRAYPIIKRLQEKLGDDLKFVFRNFPLSEIHPLAVLAAVATEAAAKQGKFWEMHDIVFEHQIRLYKRAILEYAQALDLDIEQFEADLEDEILLEKVNADFESGLRSGVNGTPTFFIDSEKYTGAWEDGSLEAVLKSKIVDKKGA